MTIKKSYLTMGNATKAEVNETIDKAKRYNQIINIKLPKFITYSKLQTNFIF